MGEQLPHGYTNVTRWSDGLVLKSYRGPDGARRRANEMRALDRFAGLLPVPAYEVVGDDLRLSRLPGVPGQEVLLTAPAEVLTAVGSVCRQMHEAAPGQVHGDFGPQNLLIHSDTFDVTGIVDWEFAGPGEPVVDLAWAEWIIRTHHPDLVAHLPALFVAYGVTPAWPARHQAMLIRCAELLDFVVRWTGPDAPGVELWRRRIAATTRFEERVAGGERERSDS